MCMGWKAWRAGRATEMVKRHVPLQVIMRKGEWKGGTIFSYAKLERRCTPAACWKSSWRRAMVRMPASSRMLADGRLMRAPKGNVDDWRLASQRLL